MADVMWPLWKMLYIVYISLIHLTLYKVILRKTVGVTGLVYITCMIEKFFENYYSSCTNAALVSYSLVLLWCIITRTEHDASYS